MLTPMSISELEAAWAGRPPDWEAQWADVNERREAALPDYQAVLSRFLEGDSDAPQFRTELDSLSKRKNVFGFRGTNQMFLNQLVGSADQGHVDDALREALVPPADSATARQKLQGFSDFIESVREHSTVDVARRPALGRVPAFVSFFWELAEREEWPQLYPSSRDVLKQHGLLDTDGSAADVYAQYRDRIFNLRDRFGAETWTVEHFLYERRPGTNPGGTEYDGNVADSDHNIVSSEALVEALARFSNVILEGPPGTGKTFAIKGIAGAWNAVTGRDLGGDGAGRYALTMHPSTSYEDFVEGLRFDENEQAFRPREGFIQGVIAEARDAPDKDFLVLLDEINRANIPKVLGDLLMGMEHSKRAVWDPSSQTWRSEFEVTLPYSGNQFFVPANVYLLGTMNTSDRSIAPMDSALRRRFAFIRALPLRGGDLRAALEESLGANIAEALSESVDRLDGLNRILRKALGPDSELGHSYLFDISPREASAAGVSLPAGTQRVFWIETRKGQGGSGNQIDLSGSEDLLYPLQTTAGVQSAKDRNRPDEFPLIFDGKHYDGNRLKYQTGAPVWRLFLEGRTSDDARLSGVASQAAPTPDHQDARRFEHRFLLFVENAAGILELSAIDITSQTRAALHALTPDVKRTQQGGHGREFGVIDSDLLAAQSDDEPWRTWRFSILPQLVDNVISAGAEELFNPATRTQWLAANGLQDLASDLYEFDQFLASMNIELSLVGSGLAANLLIQDVRQQAEAIADGPNGNDGSEQNGSNGGPDQEAEDSPESATSTG